MREEKPAWPRARAKQGERQVQRPGGGTRAAYDPGRSQRFGEEPEIPLRALFQPPGPGARSQGPHPAQVPLAGDLLVVGSASF